jgi:hypothetical protein
LLTKRLELHDEAGVKQAIIATKDVTMTKKQQQKKKKKKKRTKKRKAIVAAI